ncbi:MAG: HAD-IIB family hydrolase [Betaproteobacteria bacterium]
MLPLDALPASALAAMQGVFTDIDDTLTTRGALTAQAYVAMQRLRNVGLLVIPVTGRPAGWCDHIARLWPVSAVVGENGALYMRHDAVARKLRVRHFLDVAERERNRGRLAAIGERIVREIPGCALASDQRYRESDLAIDYCEDVALLPASDVERIVALMRAEGLTAKVSSIHVNGWFGAYDKLGMTRRLLAEEFGIDLDAARHRFMFVGDSPNDAPMFEYFPYSIGVANVGAFGDRIATPPKFVTRGESGAGFVEVADRLVEARG